jgi:predicted MFS family arabinose efflux permease
MAEIDWRLTFVIIGLFALILIAAVIALFAKTEGRRKGLTIKVLGTQLAATIANKNIALLSLAGFLAFFSQIGVMSFVSEHLESGEIEYSSVEIGIVLGVSGLLGLLVSPLSGKLVDVRGARCCSVVGFVLVGVSSFTMQFGDAYGEFLLMMAVLGIGTSFIWASLLTMVVRAYPSLKGTSSSVFNSARFLGYAVSPLALAPLFVLTGFAEIMILCAVLSGLALLLALLTDRILSRR